MATRDVTAGRRVLLAQANRFQREYLASALRTAGHVVLEPADGGDRLIAIASDDPPPRAAVIDLSLALPILGSLTSLARRRSIALLITADRDVAPPPDLGGAAQLVRPFAAYQIVDWLVGIPE